MRVFSVGQGRTGGARADARRGRPVLAHLSRPWPDRGLRGRGLVAGALVLLLAGCRPAIQWRLGFFDDAIAEARSKNKLTFVYFRNWHSVDCTHFEEQVLSSKPVTDATRGMTCVPLEFDVASDRRLAESWGIRRVPACAIVDPGGAVLASASGDITQETLLAAIRQAQERFASSTRPVVPP